MFLKLVLAVVGLLLAASPALADTIRVQSTFDVNDAGLFPDLTIPMYESSHPGDTIAPTYAGTGAALNNARNGLGDVVITHAPTLEQTFQDQGFSLEGAGRAIFYSDYVIVGPLSDPAGVATTARHDAISAFEAIAHRGDSTGANHDVTFVSRGDNSGTNVQEEGMWNSTDSTVPKIAGGGANRQKPSDTAWYKTTGHGQAQSLDEASACSAGSFPQGNCYTIVDRGTFNREFNLGNASNLKIVSDKNTPDARGGENLLINPFSAYVVAPNENHPGQPFPGGSPVPNTAAATRFLDFLTSKAFQDAVDGYPSATDPAFLQDAFPLIALNTALPQSVVKGSALRISINATNRQKGAPAVNGMPVQLQQSLDSGQTWSNAGAPQNTDASGNTFFDTTVGANTRYRVSTNRFKATTWNAFSPNTQDIGAVTATDAPKPTPIDKTKPKLTKLKMTKKGFAVNITEKGKLKWGIKKRGKGGKFKRVRGATVKAKRKGRLRVHFKHGLPAGTYKLTIRCTDTSGNARRKVLDIKLKP